MNLHGSTHLTADIDFCYDRSPENLAAVVAALARYHPRLAGAPPDLPFLWDARTLKSGLNFTLDTDIGAVDILGEAAGVDSFDGLWERSVEMGLDGIHVHVASIDDLIAMKKAANRPKDQTHALELEDIRAVAQQIAGELKR